MWADAKSLLTVCARPTPKALGVPKSDLQIARGTRSKEKLISVGGKGVQGGQECVGRLLKRLGEAVQDGGDG